MDTVLLVDDDKILRYTLRENLERESFVILEAAGGSRALEILQSHPVDLILLDLQLSDGNGLDFMRSIRERTTAPVIIVSGEDETALKVNGFDLGADDYVLKPIDTDELIARIHAHLRRCRDMPLNENHKPEGEHETLRFSGWTLDPARFQIFNQAGISGDLTIREFRLLQILVKNAGRALKRDELGEAIREQNYVPTPRAIDVKITRIRRKIGDGAADPHMIRTVYGIGYMFDPASLEDAVENRQPAALGKSA